MEYEGLAPPSQKENHMQSRKGEKVSPHGLPAESDTERNQGKYFTAGLHFVCEKVSLSLQMIVSLLFSFIYLFSLFLNIC